MQGGLEGLRKADPGRSVWGGHSHMRKDLLAAERGRAVAAAGVSNFLEDGASADGVLPPTSTFGLHKAHSGCSYRYR